jgi:AcrR family transcriptional regulator
MNCKLPEKKVAARGRPVNPQRRRETRRSITVVALDEFTEKGFDKARISEIARRAGVAKGTVYLYFDSKETLFEGLLHELIGNPFDAVGASALKETERVGEYLRRVFDCTLENFEESPRAKVLQILLAEGASIPALADSYHRVIISPMLEEIGRLAAVAVKRGEVAPEILEHYPMLIFAVGLLGLTWNRIFKGTRNISLSSMMGSHIELLFGAKPS